MRTKVDGLQDMLTYEINCSDDMQPTSPAPPVKSWEAGLKLLCILHIRSEARTGLIFKGLVAGAAHVPASSPHSLCAHGVQTAGSTEIQ